MLTRISSTIAANLATILTSKNITLVPKNLTLLSELSNCDMTYGVVDINSDIADTLESSFKGTVTEHKGQSNYVQSKHDILVDNYTKDLTDLVTGYISFARNVVNKEVLVLREKLQDSLESYKYKEPEDLFNVKYYKLHDVFKSSLIDEEIQTYSSYSKSIYDTVDFSKLPSDFNLAAYILTGDQEQDSIIQSWFNSSPNPLISYVANTINEYSLSTIDSLDYSLINYLFYRSLLNKTDIDLGLSLVSLKKIAIANKDYFGAKLYVALDLYKKEIKNGRILCNCSNTSFSYFNRQAIDITIYEDNFDEFVKQGGNVEIIFGYISVSKEHTVNISDLIVNKDKYLSRWNNSRSLYLISLNKDRLDIFKQLLRQAFDSSIADYKNSEQEDLFYSKNANYLQETCKLCHEYIDKLEVSNIDDLDAITLDLVAKIRYRFTNSYYILKEMKEIMEMSDSVDPLEAALYSTVKYLVDFFVQELDVVKH